MRAVLKKEVSMLSLPKLYKRIHKCEDGAAAVEFALVAVPFFICLFAIIELALVFLISQVMEEATNYASRYVMTGRSADGTTVVSGTGGGSGTLSQAEFKQKVCDYIPALFSCNKVIVDLTIYDTFNGAITTKLYKESNTLETFGGYGTTSGNAIAVVRAGYNYNVYVAKLLPWMLDNTQNGHTIMAVRSFRVEPF